LHGKNLGQMCRDKHNPRNLTAVVAAGGHLFEAIVMLT